MVWQRAYSYRFGNWLGFEGKRSFDPLGLIVARLELDCLVDHDHSSMTVPDCDYVEQDVDSQVDGGRVVVHHDFRRLTMTDHLAFVSLQLMEPSLPRRLLSTPEKDD